MSPKQTSLYWREWAAVRRVCPEADRHELHARALGLDKSSKEFTNADFDKVLAEFRAISEPDNLEGQLRQISQPVRRLIWRIRKLAPESYWRAIARDKFGTETLAELSEGQLTMLRNTLAARANALRKRSVQEAGPRAERAVQEECEQPF